MTTTDQPKGRRCSMCGEVVGEYELQACMICRSLFCHRCAVEGYGRYFCSDICRGFFFHGDGDDDKEDF